MRAAAGCRVPGQPREGSVDGARMSSRETTGTAAQQELLARAYRQVEAARLVAEFATDLNAAVNLFEVALPVGIYFRQQPGFDQVCLIPLDAADSMVGLRDSPEAPSRRATL